MIRVIPQYRHDTVRRFVTGDLAVDAPAPQPPARPAPRPAPDPDPGRADRSDDEASPARSRVWRRG